MDQEAAQVHLSAAERELVHQLYGVQQRQEEQAARVERMAELWREASDMFTEERANLEARE